MYLYSKILHWCLNYKIIFGNLLNFSLELEQDLCATNNVDLCFSEGTQAIFTERIAYYRFQVCLGTH